MRSRYVSPHLAVYLRDIRVKAYSQFLDAYLSYVLPCSSLCRALRHHLIMASFGLLPPLSLLGCRGSLCVRAV